MPRILWRLADARGAGSDPFLEPEVLLLDEPTNYLDLEGTLWLETYLKTYPHTVVIVSHDRDLLNRAVGHILHLERGKLTFYTGGYDDFEEARRERQRLELKLRRNRTTHGVASKRSSNDFKAKASKAAQAQSRIKALGTHAADRGSGRRSRDALHVASAGKNAGEPTHPHRRRSDRI